MRTQALEVKPPPLRPIALVARADARALRQRRSPRVCSTRPRPEPRSVARQVALFLFPDFALELKTERVDKRIVPSFDDEMMWTTA